GPEAPTIATDAPEATLKLTSSRIVNGSSPLVTILVKRAARRIGGTKRSELAEVRATRRVVSRFILREATRYGRARFAVAAGVSTIPSTIHAPYERKRNSMPTRRSQFAFFAAALLALLAATISPAGRAEASAPVVLVVGDSISAGYGLTNGTGWVDLLAKRIDAQHLAWRVVNASITGDTTAGGRARLPALLAQHKPAVVIVELGGNDGLRGGNLKSTKD